MILIGLLGFGLSMALLATTIALGAAGLLSAVAVYPLLIVSRCVFALIGSGTGPASQAYIADRTTTADRAAGLALVSAAMGFGETHRSGAWARRSPRSGWSRRSTSPRRSRSPAPA